MYFVSNKAEKLFFELLSKQLITHKGKVTKYISKKYILFKCVLRINNSGTRNYHIEGKIAQAELQEDTLINEANFNSIFDKLLINYSKCDLRFPIARITILIISTLLLKHQSAGYHGKRSIDNFFMTIFRIPKIYCTKLLIS